MGGGRGGGGEGVDAAESLLDRYRNAQDANAIRRANRARARWGTAMDALGAAAAAASMPPTPSAAGGGGDGSSSSAPRRRSLGRMLGAAGKEGEAGRLRRAYAREYMEKHRMRECLRLLARHVAEQSAASAASEHRQKSDELEREMKEAISKAEMAGAMAQAQDLQVQNQALLAAVDRLQRDYREAKGKQAPPRLVTKFARNKQTPQSTLTTGASPPASPRGEGAAALGLGCGPVVLNASKIWGPTDRTALQVASDLAMELEEMGGCKNSAVRRLDADFMQWALSACELQHARAPPRGDDEALVELLTLCKRLLRAHAAAALGRSVSELTAADEAAFAYVIDGAPYTVADMDAQMLGARIVAEA